MLLAYLQVCKVVADLLNIKVGIAFLVAELLELFRVDENAFWNMHCAHIECMFIMFMLMHF
jgi:hypothetical protein